MDSHHGVLAKLSCAAFQQMQELSSFAKGHPFELQTPLNDALIRFQMWARNINAFQNNELSLGHRVRDAPKLRTSFETRLNDLQEDLSDLNDTLSTVSHEDIATFISSESQAMKEPASFVWEETEETLTSAQDSCLDLFQLLKAINEDVSSLFKLSALTKQATRRDPYMTALARVDDTQVTDEEIDIELVGDRFPRLKQPGLRWLRLRLARANHVRRIYLKYRGDHYGLITTSSEKGHQEGVADNADTASTVAPEKFGLLESHVVTDDNRSQASFVSYATETSSHQGLTVEDLEDIRCGKDVFICPCCRNEQTLETQAAWRRHVLSDLRAYTCTAQLCELKMFETSSAWLKHQLTEHLAVWRCPFCQKHEALASAHVFQAHMRRNHSTSFYEGQLPQLTATSRHDIDSIAAEECLFCDWSMKMRNLDNVTSGPGKIRVEPDRYRRHVCSHLEQAALSTIAATTTEEELDSDGPENTTEEDPVVMIPCMEDSIEFEEGAETLDGWTRKEYDPGSSPADRMVIHQEAIVQRQKPRKERRYSSDIGIKFRGMFKSPKYYIKRVHGGSARRSRDEYDPRRPGNLLPEVSMPPLMPPPYNAYQSSRSPPPPSPLPILIGSSNRPMPPQGPSTDTLFTTREVDLPPSAVPITRSSSRGRDVHRAVQGLPHLTVPVDSNPVPSHTSRRTTPGLSRISFAPNTRFQDLAYGPSLMSDTDTPKADSSTPSETRSKNTSGHSANDRYNYTDNHVAVRRGKEVYRDEDEISNSSEGRKSYRIVRRVPGEHNNEENDPRVQQELKAAIDYQNQAVDHEEGSILPRPESGRRRRHYRRNPSEE